MVVDRGRRPVTGVDGRQHIDFNGRRAEHEVTFRCDVAGVVNDNGHHRYARLHRQMERPLLEGPEQGRHGARALGRQGDGFVFVAHGLDKGLHGFDRRGGVLAVDHDDAAEFHHLADQRHLLNFLLADASQVPAQQLCADNDIGLALVIEDKHGGALRPQVLLAANAKVQIDQRAGRFCEERDRKVRGLATGTGKGIDRQAGGKGRHQTRRRRDGAQELSQGWSAATSEAGRRPRVVARQGAELFTRI